MGKNRPMMTDGMITTITILEAPVWSLQWSGTMDVEGTTLFPFVMKLLVPEVATSLWVMIVVSAFKMNASVGKVQINNHQHLNKIGIMTPRVVI
jgi:hypothetical protein